jgi:signal transduction histidine kinase
MLGALLIGFAAGMLMASLTAAWLIRRHVRKIKDIERRLRAAERLAEIGKLTGGLAHEIKNPLSTIGLNAQLLAEGINELPIAAEERSRLTHRVDSLRREVDRLKGILTDFLEFAGEMRLEPAPVDINALVDELADFYLPQAERAGVKLRTDLAAGSMIAMIDGPHVKQAVLNLMLNAVQAIERMGQDAPARPREIILKTTPASRSSDGLIRLHVIDTGPGLDTETLARIFDPYFTTRSGGTGLGLPMTRRIIESLGGRVEVVSEPGKGSDFILALPRA